MWWSGGNGEAEDIFSLALYGGLRPFPNICELVTTTTTTMQHTHSTQNQHWWTKSTDHTLHQLPRRFAISDHPPIWLSSSSHVDSILNTTIVQTDGDCWLKTKPGSKKTQIFVFRLEGKQFDVFVVGIRRRDGRTVLARIVTTTIFHSWYHFTTQLLDKAQECFFTPIVWVFQTKCNQSENQFQ